MKKITFFILTTLIVCFGFSQQINAQISPSFNESMGARVVQQQAVEPNVTIENLLERIQSEKSFDGNLSPYELELLDSYRNSVQQSNISTEAILLEENFDDITTLAGAGYSFVNVSDAVGTTDWAQGVETVFPSQTGAPNAYISANFNNTGGSVINNFMITPVLNLENGDIITFWTRSPTASTFPDRLEVRVSPDGANVDPSGPADVGSYTELLLEINPTLAMATYPDTWTMFTATVTGLTGAVDTRVAFRYWVTDAGPAGNNSDYIGIDTLTIDEGATGGGPCAIVGDCNLMDAVPDDATSPNTWERPVGAGPTISGLGPVGYDVYGPFTVDTAGNYTMTNAYTAFDGYIHLYETCFDPLDQLTNLLAGNDDFMGTGGSQILDQPLATGTEYYIVTSGFGAGDFGDYTLDITGAGIATCGGGGMPMCFTTDSTAVPFDIDGAGNSTADCAAAPNLIPVTITETGIIGTDYNIQTVTIDILHTFAADLDLALVAPDGTMIVLAEDLGGGTDDAYNGTQFQDGGADISAATAPFGVGPYEAQGGAFSVAFAGVDMTGDWQLQVCDDAGGDTGSVVQFSIEFCPPGAAPTNDECDFAINVECGDVIAGDTSDDTDSGGNAAPDEFFKYTGDGTPLDVTLSLCDGGTAYDSLIRVYTDCTLTTEVASNDDSCGLQSELEFESDGVSTYYIMVEGFGANAGAFSLAITCASTIDNDLCENAIEIDCGDTVTGTTTNALPDNDVAGANCGTDITAPGVWYVFEDASGLAGNVTATLCNGTDYDSKISVFSGDCSALVCIDGNDDDCGLQSTISFPTDGATTFYILVHGFAANTGNFTLDLTCMPTPPPNDMIANSIDVDEIGFPYTDPAVAMPAATLEAGDPADCSINGSAGVWYNFVSANNGTATASITTPGGASAVIFYSAPDENATETDLVHVDQFNNQCLGGTSASIFTEAGQAYYVFVVNSGAISDVVIDGTQLGSSDNTIEGFAFYPNPADNLLNVTAQNTIDSVSIFNVLGQKVLNQNVGATSSQLDVSLLSTGTYIMKVSVEGEIGTYKVIKQ